jgi:hypothetical protein
MISIAENESRPVKRSPRVLLITGFISVLFSAILAIRIVWEETSLTLQQGPQMIGFSLAHGLGVFLFLAPILLSVWAVVALITMVGALWRKRPLSTWFWSTLAASIIVLGVLMLPPVFWQWMFIRSFAKSPHAADLMTYAAAEGDVRTVRGYLEHGVPLESKNYEGSTAAFTAAVGGNLPVIELLAAKGADLNSTNLYGDSPLEAATENHQEATVSFLKAHGAVQIKGTPEQRDAASESIVRREMEREAALR